MDNAEKSNIEREARDRGLGTLSSLELEYIESEVEFAMSTYTKNINKGQLIDHQQICMRFSEAPGPLERKQDITRFTLNIIGEILGTGDNNG